MREHVVKETLSMSLEINKIDESYVGKYNENPPKRVRRALMLRKKIVTEKTEL
jgi:hypothetical protein